MRPLHAHLPEQVQRGKTHASARRVIALRVRPRGVRKDIFAQVQPDAPLADPRGAEALSVRAVRKIVLHELEP